MIIESFVNETMKDLDRLREQRDKEWQVLAKTVTK